MKLLSQIQLNTLLEEIENLQVLTVVFESLQQGSVAITVCESLLVWGDGEWSDATSEVLAKVLGIEMKVFLRFFFKNSFLMSLGSQHINQLICLEFGHIIFLAKTII